MKNEVERFEAEAAIGPIVPPNSAGAGDLEPSLATFPCPGSRTGACDRAKWLTSPARAGHVYAYLDALAEGRRGPDDWNDLGCALGWAQAWAEAAKAFQAAKAGANEQQRKRAEANLEIAKQAAA
jgi:hypothetical protein